MEIASLLCFFLALVGVHCQQTYPYVSFMGQTLFNHSYVDLSRVGHDHFSYNNTLLCKTDLSSCCSNQQGRHRGDWYYPNGSRLPFAGMGGGHQIRAHQLVYLRNFDPSSSGGPPSLSAGLYHCSISTIAVHDDSNTARAIIYVGLFENRGGDITISADLAFSVLSDLNGPTPQFTLTCVSTGGPATTVTWTRDSIILTEGTGTVLNDPVTAQYTHTLTVTGRIPGLYNCTVANNKPSSDSRSFILDGRLRYNIVPILVVRSLTTTSINISWASRETKHTSYRIFWQRNATVGCPDEDQGSISITSGTSYNISGLEEDSEYNVTVIASNKGVSVSDSISVITLEAAPSAPPSDVTVIDVTSSSITVQWGMVPCIHQNGDITGYLVRYRVKDISGEPQTQSVWGDSVSQATISNLMSATIYSIQIAAVVGITNVGTYSNLLDALTYDVNSPTDVRATQDSASSIRVTWTPPSSLRDITGYRISYTGGGGDSCGSEDVSGGSTNTYTLTGLQNRLTYTIFIVATFQTSISENITVEVELIPAPGEVSVEVRAITATSISLSWSVASGSVSSWEVVWREINRVTESLSGSLPGTSYTIDQLDSTTYYTVRVTATNVAGTTSSNTFFIFTSRNIDESSSKTFSIIPIPVIITVVAVVVFLILMTVVLVLISRMCKHNSTNKNKSSSKIPESFDQALELSTIQEPVYINVNPVHTTSNKAYNIVKIVEGIGGKEEIETPEIVQLPHLTTS